jgi:hypothetical protein
MFPFQQPPTDPRAQAATNNPLLSLLSTNHPQSATDKQLALQQQQWMQWMQMQQQPWVKQQQPVGVYIKCFCMYVYIV